MTSCIPDVPATNPLSQLIVSSLGDNYHPPYDPNFQPADRGKLVSDKFLNWQLPGGGKFTGLGDPKHGHITEALTPLSGMLSTVFSFFGPIYIILDVIRAIIDIICALFNPIPLVLSVVELFVNVLPPLVALFPPFSSILLAINTIKLIVSIVGGIAASLIPVIADIVDNALTVAAELSQGNLAAVENVEVKLCQLFQEFANVLAGFTPIKFILEIIDIFMNLGAKFFCAPSQPGSPGSPCCTAENCPPIVINPPKGRMRVVSRIKKYTLQDFANEAFALINIPLAGLADFLNFTLGKLFDVIDTIVNGIETGIENLVKPIQDAINLVIGLVGAPPISLDALNLPRISIPKPELNLHIPTPTGFDGVVFVKPLTTLQYITATSKANDTGIVSAVGVGYNYSQNELAALQNFIIDPDKISSPDKKMPAGLGSSAVGDGHPVTIQVKLTRLSTGQTVLADAVFEFPTFQTIANSLKVSTTGLLVILNTAGLGFLPTQYLGMIQIRDDTFGEGAELQYEIVPNYTELLKQNLIGLGCYPDVQQASGSLNSLINADAGALIPGTNGFDSVSIKIGGRSIPAPPIADLQKLLAQIQVDPTTPVNPLNILNDYLDDLADVYDSLICVGASAIQSLFQVSKNNVLADGKDRAVLAVRIRDAGGNNLLVGGKLPGSNFRVEFNAPGATIGPVSFDETTGTFTASITSQTVSQVDITANFIVREKLCTRLSTFTNFPAVGEPNTKPTVVSISFVPERSAYPKVRRQNQYVQSRGGRVRA